MYRTENRNRGNGFFLAWAILFTLLYLGWAGWRIVNNYTYDIHCGGHLKRAADANTIDLAKQELDVALKYIEAVYTPEQLEHGNTGVFLSLPANDLGFWHKNLQASLVELQTVKSDAPQLERSNVLMKLRETLLDSAEHGMSVTHPNGISVFPYNVSQFWFAWIVAILAAVNWIIWGVPYLNA